ADVSRLVIGAGTRWFFAGNIDPINSRSGLRWNKPHTAFFTNAPSRCKLHTALLSQVHTYLAYLIRILLSRYILVKEILDGISLFGICSVRYGTHPDQANGIQMRALRAPVGAPQEHQ